MTYNFPDMAITTWDVNKWRARKDNGQYVEITAARNVSEIALHGIAIMEFRRKYG